MATLSSAQTQIKKLMVDTVTAFAPSCLLKLNPPQGWDHSNYYGEVPDPNGIGFIRQRSFSYDDTKTGYHGHGHGDEIRYHRASLPRLFHGDNGKLIKSQSELEVALDLLQLKAGEICNANFGNLHFTRVDLVWQFRGNTADYILAHRHARHPRLRKGPVSFEISHAPHSLNFIGSEMKIRIYDKSMQMLKRKGDIVRVEIELHGRRLMEELGNGDRVTKLDFLTCYQAYRRILLGFEPSPIPNIGNIVEFLSIGEREGWESSGIAAFDIYTKNMSQRNVRRLQCEMAACRPAIHQIDWQQLLPADGPPTPVELNEK